MDVLKKHLFWIVLLGIVLYLFLFFSTPFEPYQAAMQANGEDGETWKRGTFFSYLLLPDEYFSAWIGPEGKINLADRIPILLATLLCLLSAFGLGAPLFSSLFFKILSGKSLRLDFFVFSTVFGLAAISTGLFLAMISSSDSLRGIYSLCISCCLGIPIGITVLKLKSNRKDAASTGGRRSKAKLKSFPVFWLVPLFFSLLLVLGGMIPSTDYDVLSYHFAGAREFAEAGRIEFLPHNVYANMPFGAEMFVVWGIALLGDPFRGAMVGKTIIALTTVLTALGVYSFGRRYFSETAGLVGMILYLTTPWILYVSTVGLIDSVVGMYSFFALYALCLTAEANDFFSRSDENTERQRPEMQNLSVFLCATLTGVFAGAATACKYPAALFVVVPVGVTVVFVSINRTKQFSRALSVIVLFGLAVLAFCGGWFVKNWFYTGNPVYPLCFSIFGDLTGSLTPDANLRWTEAHRPHGFDLMSFGSDFRRVLMSSPWNAPLTVPLCLLVFLAPLDQRQRRIACGLAVWVLFVLTAWWFLTHRIDRFWIPIFPALSVLAGIGATWSTTKAWNRLLVALLGIAVVYGFLLGGAPAPGKMNRFLASLDSLRTDPNISTPWAVWFNSNQPKGKILLVGEAKAFLYDGPVLYSTCWNETPLKAIVELGGIESIKGQPEKLIEEFQQRRISTILVDWGEINRFRSPGNYGFSDFVRPEVFQKLVQDGVLEPFWPNEELRKTSTIAYRVSVRTAEPTSVTTEP